MAQESLNDYPPVPGMEEELLALTKAMLSKGISDKMQLYCEMSRYYADRCGLEVTPPANAEDALKSFQGPVEQALKEVLAYHKEMVKRGDGATDILLATGILADQIPRVFASYSIPPTVYDEMCRKLTQKRIGIVDAHFDDAFASLSNLLTEVCAVPDGAFSEGALMQYLLTQDDEAI